MLVMTPHDQPNWAGLHSVYGKLWAEWIDATGEMTWVEQDLTGQWTGVQIEPFNSVEDRDFHVRGRIRFEVLD